MKYLRDLEVSLWKVAWFFVEIALFQYYLPLPFFLPTHSLFPLSLFFIFFSSLLIIYLFSFLSFSVPLPPSHLFALSLSLSPILFLSSFSFPSSPFSFYICKTCLPSFIMNLSSRTFVIILPFFLFIILYLFFSIVFVHVSLYTNISFFSCILFYYYYYYYVHSFIHYHVPYIPIVGQVRYVSFWSLPSFLPSFLYFLFLNHAHIP